MQRGLGVNVSPRAGSATYRAETSAVSE
jgi:hypothetical protein